MKTVFESLADALSLSLHDGERMLLYLKGESTDFVRYNHAKIRQAGHVRASMVELRLLNGERHASAFVELSSDPLDQLREVVSKLRALLPSLPDDPHLALSTVRTDTDATQHSAMDAAVITSTLLAATADHDFVGIQASGRVFRGFADSGTGQRNWLERDSFHVDGSLHDGDRSTKFAAAGVEWNPSVLERAVAQSIADLPALALPVRAIEPGLHRAYLAPAAVVGLLSMTGYSGFGHAHKVRGTSCLQRGYEGQSLHPSVSMREDVVGGLAPNFDPFGFARPDRIELVRAGVFADTLVNPASSREFGVPCTGAGPYEGTESLVLDPGDLPEDEVLAALGTGLYVSNLHYLNFSDFGAAKVTGLTRFACFWVENGEVVAPIPIMRFDDSLLDVFGSRLERLTDTSHLFPDGKTYIGRSTSSTRAPGALLSGFQLTS